MKPLAFIGFVLAAFLIWVGLSTRVNSGAVLGNALIVGGAIIVTFIVAVWIALKVKERQK